MGGLIQLAAYGNQDVFLTGNPQITFWKMVFKRHTHFAIESIEQPFTGNPTFGSTSGTSKVSLTLPKNTADLIHKCHLQIELQKGDGSDDTLKDNFGLKLLNRVTLSIDGQAIDSHTGEWMEYWNEYTMEKEKESGYAELIGNSESFGSETNTTVIVPLQFYFCKHAGLSLPIHALQHSEVKVIIEFNKQSDCCNGSTISMKKCTLFVDYVFLDIAEKEQILQGEQSFLISQVQETSNLNIRDSGWSDEYNVKLDFLHPVKELIWCFKDSSGLCVMKSAYITMNGSQKRASERPGLYYRRMQPYDHHTRIPTRNLYNYSFALKPEDAQPSGTCNFSRLDNAYLYFKLLKNEGERNIKVKVYATNTNLLRIYKNIGALAYS